jgi:hypothetical protein
MNTARLTALLPPLCGSGGRRPQRGPHEPWAGRRAGIVRPWRDGHLGDTAVMALIPESLPAGWPCNQQRRQKVDHVPRQRRSPGVV